MQPSEPDTKFAPAAPAVDARGQQHVDAWGGQRGVRRTVDVRGQMHTDAGHGENGRRAVDIRGQMHTDGHGDN